MKPNFALILSADGISLLKRGKGEGWLRVGEVPLSENGLDEALSELRQRAETLGSLPIRSKLILPNDQIRYITVPDSGAPKPDVATILDGQTPYHISELVTDWAREDGKLHVAAVARETLEEAESFAVSHKFGPVSFVANTEHTTFPREVWFGQTRAALSFLAPSEKVERDLTPIRISGFAAMPRVAAPDPVPTTEPAPEPNAEAKVSPEPEHALPTNTQAKPSPAPAETPPKPPRISPDAPLSDLTETGPISFSSSRTDKPATQKISEPDPRLAKSLEPRPAQPPSDMPSEGFFSRRAPAPQPPKATPEAKAPSVIPPPPESAAAISVQTVPQPNLQAPAAKPAQGQTGTPPAKTQAKPTLKLPYTLEQGAPNEADDKVENMPGGPVLTARQFAPINPKLETEETSAAKHTTADQDELRSMTVFGARDTPTINGKPRYLGLILTIVLLLFMAAVAVYASVFLKDGLASLWRNNDSSTVVEAPSRPIIGTQTNQAEEAADLAALATGESLSERPALPSITQTEHSEETQPARQSETLSPQEVQTRYAATGIWQSAPREPAQPTTRGLDRLTLAGTDDPVPQIAAQARPASRPTEPDRALSAVAPPPLPGQRFDLDQRGLVRATPSGALSPDGHLVFQGRPTPSPPQRSVTNTSPQTGNVLAPSASETTTTPPPVTTTAPVPVPRIGPRPRLRPQTNSTALPTPLETTFIALVEEPRIGPRPRLRPTSVSAEAAIDETQSEETLSLPAIKVANRARPRMRPARLETRSASLTPIATSPSVEAAAINAAVASASTVQLASIEPSPLPRTRPRNFSRVVKRATATPRAAVAVASPRRATVAPRIPSSASVTRQATVKNALNLRRVNLVGVYGKPSRRRALVRLSNGRFEKVKVGDRLDGGRVSAISDGRLNYTKGGRTVTLSMPRG